MVVLGSAKIVVDVLTSFLVFHPIRVRVFWPFEARERGLGHEEDEAHRGADCVCSEAGGDGYVVGGGGVGQGREMPRGRKASLAVRIAVSLGLVWVATHFWLLSLVKNDWRARDHEGALAGIGALVLVALLLLTGITSMAGSADAAWPREVADKLSSLSGAIRAFAASYDSGGGHHSAGTWPHTVLPVIRM